MRAEALPFGSMGSDPRRAAIDVVTATSTFMAVGDAGLARRRRSAEDAVGVVCVASVRWENSFNKRGNVAAPRVVDAEHRFTGEGGPWAKQNRDSGGSCAEEGGEAVGRHEKAQVPLLWRSRAWSTDRLN